MTREEFITYLRRSDITYTMRGDIISVEDYLGDDDGVPNSDIFLSLRDIPSGVEFLNSGHVTLEGLETLPPGIEFDNGGDVYFDGVVVIHPGVIFTNGGDVYFDGKTLSDLGVDSPDGVSSLSLLNFMVSRGIFL